MSRISSIVMTSIAEYINNKRGEWNKPEPPPEETFTTRELYAIGDNIVSEIEGTLSDKFIGS